MPHHLSTSRLKSLAGLLTAAFLATALAGCSSLHGVTSPRSAREDAPKDAKVAAGEVDCRKAKCVALTFDGGPSAPTPKLLDILKKEKLHATFFLQGKGHIDTYPDTVRRMAAEGNEVANHTWTHAVLTDIKADQVRQELGKVQDPIEKLTGKKPTLMRPPQGRTSDDVSKIMREMGLAQILWSTTAKDFETNDSALITKRTLDQTKRDGIILLHDRYKGTIPAVPGIIAELRKRGYTIVTVSELIAPAKLEPGKVYRP
ncbi:polysaccharide deacetylase family protein [Streptomyces sp. NPDC050738]|uniref:polysaccharide deacetylase family protein n=1 Tax=Streptomyces sp. NPDC050738 TaxID=3154744 RepID=UPI0034149A90